MKVIQQGKRETYQDFYPEQYEFKLCGGSVEPDDRIDMPIDAGDRVQAASEAVRR